MDFTDPVYGEQTVATDVLQELIKSDPVQRLQHINQAGPQYLFTDKPVVTRFEHSIGVMFLLQKHGASLEEQIAGLLHDVPHTAFSHVADFVFETEEHEYHERFMEKIVYDSSIPDILARHDLDTDYILDESNFPLLEQDLPDLCGDRVDYFLRDVAVCGDKPIDAFRDALTTHNDCFALDDPGVAERYALTYIWADEAFWANPKEVVIFELFARALRRGLDIGLLTEDDLFGTDDAVWALLRDADDAEIQEQLDTVRDGFEVVLDEHDPDMCVETKVRYVDPLVVMDGEIFRISERSDMVQERIEEHASFVGDGYPVRLI